MKTVGPWSESKDFPRLFSYYFVHGSGARSSGSYRLTQSEHRTGYNSGPGWKHLASIGQLPPHDASLVKNNEIEVRTPASIVKTTWDTLRPKAPPTTVSFYGHGYLMSNQNLDNVFGTAPLTSVWNDAKRKLNTKLAGVNFDSLVFAAEFKKTSNHIVSLSQQLSGRALHHERRVLNDLRSGRHGPIKSALQIQNIAASRWLEFQMAIKPTISDMQDLGETLAKLQTGYARKKFSASSKKNFSKTVRVKTYSPPLIGKVGSGSLTYDRRIEVKVGTHVDLTDPYYDTYGLRMLGLERDNILPALWELIPYSWLIDYFTNVGDLIKAYSLRSPVLHHTWGVQVVEDVVSWDMTLHTNDSNVHLTGNGDKGSWRKFRFNRFAYPSLDQSFEFTSWDDLSLTKQLNVGALASVLLSRASSSRSILLRLVGIG